MEGGYFDGQGGRSHFFKVYQPALGLGDDLLGDHQNVAVLQLHALCGDGVRNQAAQVVAGLNFGQTFDASDANFRNHDAR